MTALKFVLAAVAVFVASALQPPARSDNAATEIAPPPALDSSPAIRPEPSATPVTLCRAYVGNTRICADGLVFAYAGQFDAANPPACQIWYNERGAVYCAVNLPTPTAPPAGYAYP